MTRKFVFYVTLVVLLGSLLVPVSGQDENTFVAAKFDTDALDLSDGEIASEWDNVQYFQSIEELGTEGFVKFSGNSTHIFSLWKVDSTKEWVAIETSASDDCMVQKNDGWTFYIDQSSGDVEYHDEVYRGARQPLHDSSNDISIEVVQEGNYHFIEIVRELSTGDEYDIEYTEGELINVKFASSTHHYTSTIFDNPTDFGPSDIYYLSVQLGGGEIVVPDAPKTIDYQFWKMTAFILVFILAAGFISIHFTIRQVLRPVHHPSRIVDEDFERPTLKSRWESLKGQKPTNTGEEA